jgi:PIN domain nuclease of toxin-antitoxin system
VNLSDRDAAPYPDRVRSTRLNPAGAGERFIAEAGLTHEIALHSRMIELPHRDPADRFIAATALVNGFHLATSDQPTFTR